jgi:hypothetical protein
MTLGKDLAPRKAGSFAFEANERYSPNNYEQ